MLLNWYALYTKPRAEKKTHAALTRKGIESYLPLVKTLKQWSDRKKMVEEPLFRSYLFVHIPIGSYYDMLNTPGVVRCVTFEGRPVMIPEQQILAVRMYVDEKEILPVNTGIFSPGKEVEVIRGPLRGLTGELVTFSGQNKVRIEVDVVGQSVWLTIPVNYLKVIHRNKMRKERKA